MTNTQRGILILIKAALTGKVPEPYQEVSTNPNVHVNVTENKHMAADPNVNVTEDKHTADAPNSNVNVTNIPNTLPPDFDLEAAYKEIRRHQIVPLAYAGAVLCGVPKEHPVMQQMFRIYLQQMMHSERQMATVDSIFAAFDQHGIDYLPLKGSTLKSLYPKPEYRLMGDADILIRQEQYSKAEPFLKDLGFTFKGANPHEYTWLSADLYLELHTYMFAYILKDYYNYYEDSWKLATPAPQPATDSQPDDKSSERASSQPATCAVSNNSGNNPDQAHSHRHQFTSNEDEFIYLFTHYAKHVRTGGIGCRHIIDLWVYRSAFPQMDEEYIINLMRKMNLHDFYATTLSLLEVWFGDEKSKSAQSNTVDTNPNVHVNVTTNKHMADTPNTNVNVTEATEFLSEFIFSSGNWGDAKTHALASELMEMQNRGNTQYNQKSSLLRKAFPHINHMSTRYPVLKKHPALLPVFWPVRIASAVLFRRDNVSHIWKANQYATAEKIDDFQEVMETIGLKFDFGSDDSH